MNFITDIYNYIVMSYTNFIKLIINKIVHSIYIIVNIIVISNHFNRPHIYM